MAQGLPKILKQGVKHRSTPLRALSLFNTMDAASESRELGATMNADAASSVGT
jgi:hypothetical protein